MNDLEYKQEILDTKSASFCGAKWYNATIWLGSGMTTSCHHPLPHKIDLEAIKTNPSAIHNTVQKKEQRRQMQCGERPKGCEYCWKIEDINRDNISDRVYKSKIFSNESLNYAYKTDYNTDVNLKTLEIAFDRTCQFACSYCNPAFSTSWVKDISDASWHSPIGDAPVLTTEQNDQNTAGTHRWTYEWDEDAYQSDNTTGWSLTNLLA